MKKPLFVDLPMFAQNGSLLVMQATYVGISGAVNGLIPNYAETRYDGSANGVGCCQGGGPPSVGMINGPQERERHEVTHEAKDGHRNGNQARPERLDRTLPIDSLQMLVALIATDRPNPPINLFNSPSKIRLSHFHVSLYSLSRSISSEGICLGKMRL